MDPYRPNPYGQPRPGGFSSTPRPFGVPGYSARPPARATPSPYDTGKLTTVFVGAIAAGVNDVWIERFLKACGSLRQWKRVTDPGGKLKGFGFAEYEDPDSVLRALHVLGGSDGHEGVTLLAMDGSDVKKKLIVKVDDVVKEHLEQYKKTRVKAENEVEETNKALESVKQLVQALHDGHDPDAPPRAAAPVSSEEDIITKELAFFKDRAVKRDQEKHRREQDRSRERWSDHDHRRRGDRFSRQDFHRGHTEQLSEPDSCAEDDEENERRRVAQHEKDVQSAFQQREKRYENRESSRLRNYHRDVQRENEEDERETNSRVYWTRRLAEWDDEVEMDRGEEFYVSRGLNSSRWRKSREDVKRREEERDQEDRRAEVHEIEEAKRRAEEEERMRRESNYLNRDSDEVTRIEIKPRKLNFNLPIKRVTNMGGNEEEEEEEGAKKKRVLVPLDYGDDMTLEGASNLDPEERTQRVKELIGSIPSSEQELWNWSVKWNEVDDDLVSSKLQPFVSKKIIEIVGVQEDDLVNFILDFVRTKKSPTDLVTELEMTLDEEALVFVMKLWRALIFETERKFQRL
ncbi:hypothetical protein BDF14DRAFT_1734970 [Spinellus fusiger]|nr:hypothetical protein BDF14DRAFT_1734970 [Spinellus fusiger]